MSASPPDPERPREEQPAPPGDAPPPAGPRPARPPRKRPKPAPAIPERTPPPDKLTIGRVAAAHGVHGEFRMAILSGHPEHFENLRRVYLGDEAEPRRLERVRLHRGEALLKVEGLAAPADVVARRGQLVRIARADAMPLPEGEYYHYELLGLAVVDTAGQPLGRLAEIIETGANDVYVVRGGPRGEVLLPAIAEVIREVDPDAGTMVVKPQEPY